MKTDAVLGIQGCGVYEYFLLKTHFCVGLVCLPASTDRRASEASESNDMQNCHGLQSGMLTRPEVDVAEAKSMRPRPTLTRLRPILH